jgi:hypothetical protein
MDRLEPARSEGISSPAGAPPRRGRRPGGEGIRVTVDRLPAANARTGPNPLAALTNEQLLAYAAARLAERWHDEDGAREVELVWLFRALSEADQKRVLGLVRAAARTGCG